MRFACKGTGFHLKIKRADRCWERPSTAQDAESDRPVRAEDPGLGQVVLRLFLRATTATERRGGAQRQSRWAVLGPSGKDEVADATSSQFWTEGLPFPWACLLPNAPPAGPGGQPPHPLCAAILPASQAHAGRQLPQDVRRLLIASDNSWGDRRLAGASHLATER